MDHDDGGYEGSLNTYAGDPDHGAEWLVHSWIGNRSASILDMNLQVWLGPHIDVPHLIIVFGTIPNIFHFSDLVPRRDLMTDIDYLDRYYNSQNESWLALRGDNRFTWSVSHGTYMRAYLSPVGNSYVADRTDDVVGTLRAAVHERVDTWLQWVAEAQPVPESERAALRVRDHAVRTNGYTLDPMNELSKRFSVPTVSRSSSRSGRVSPRSPQSTGARHEGTRDRRRLRRLGRRLPTGRARP